MPGPKPIVFTPDMDAVLIKGRPAVSAVRLASDLGVSLTVIYRRMQMLDLPVRERAAEADFSFLSKKQWGIQSEGPKALTTPMSLLAAEPLWKAQSAMPLIPHPRCVVQAISLVETP